MLCGALIGIGITWGVASDVWFVLMCGHRMYTGAGSTRDQLLWRRSLMPGMGVFSCSQNLTTNAGKRVW